jgi:ATP-dependent DNA helicase RecG
VTFGFGPDFVPLAYEEKEDWESIPNNMLDCLYDTLGKDDADIFKIIIPHDDVVAMTTPTDGTVNNTVNDTVSGLKTEDKILEIIKQDDKISYDDMADILEMSRRGIAKQIKKLQEEGRLRRVGPDKGGHWEVTES